MLDALMGPVLDALEMANFFNTHFAAVASSITGELSHDPPSSPNLEQNANGSTMSKSCFLSQAYTCDKVHIIIHNLKPVASGIDWITSEIIKIAADYTSAPLYNPINLPFSTGVLPNLLKLAWLSPIR